MKEYIWDRVDNADAVIEINKNNPVFSEIPVNQFIYKGVEYVSRFFAVYKEI